jgi:hypothetical protein
MTRTEHSDSHILVDACLDRVRKDARLDDEPVLPPLDVTLGKEPKKLVFADTVDVVPTAQEIVKSAVKEVKEVKEPPAASPSGAVPAVSSERSLITLPRFAAPRKTLAQRMRWPVLLCGFVAGVFGGVAVMKSPVGKKPAVQHIVKKARTGASSVWGGAVAAKSRLVSH